LSDWLRKNIHNYVHRFFSSCRL